MKLNFIFLCSGLIIFLQWDLICSFSFLCISFLAAEQLQTITCLESFLHVSLFAASFLHPVKKNRFFNSTCSLLRATPATPPPHFNSPLPSPSSSVFRCRSLQTERFSKCQITSRVYVQTRRSSFSWQNSYWLTLNVQHSNIIWSSEKCKSIIDPICDKSSN